jgi:hypothetical protein
VPGGKVREDLPGAEHRGLEYLGQPHRFGLGSLAPDIVAEDQNRTLRLAQPPGHRLDRLRTCRSWPFDPVLRRLSDLRFEPLAEEQLCTDGEIHRARGWRGGFAERAGGGHGDGRRIRGHLIGGARLLGQRAHRFSLGQAGKRREATIVLKFGRPVPGDDEQ